MYIIKQKKRGASMQHKIKFYVISKLSQYVEVFAINEVIENNGLEGLVVPSFSKNGQTYYKVVITAPQSHYKALKEGIKKVRNVADVKLERGVFEN